MDASILLKEQERTGKMKSVIDELTAQGYELEFIDRLKKDGTINRLVKAEIAGQKDKTDRIREQIQQWYDEFVYFGFFDEIVTEIM